MLVREDSQRPGLSHPANQLVITCLLGGLALIGPLSVDAYLPAFEDIRQDLHIDASRVQSTLTAYMVSFAIMSLWHGALSDALGRRRIILTSLLTFAAASLGCAMSPNIYWLVSFRVLQGASAGAGTVVGRAIVRDLYDGPRAARMLSWVSMIFALSPAVAPILGGWIVTTFEWRAVFAFLGSYTAILFVFCYRALPETLTPAQRQPLSPVKMVSNYLRVGKSKHFRYAAGAIAFNFAGLFLYVAAAPVILGTHLGLSANQFGWQFVPMVGGIFLGSVAADRLAGKLADRSQIAIGFAVMVATGVVNIAYHAWHVPSMPWSISPIFFFAFGMSLAAPALTMQVLDLFADVRGLVASMQTFTMVLLAALTTAFLTPLLQESLLHLAVGQLALTMIGLLFWMSVASKPQITEK